MSFMDKAKDLVDKIEDKIPESVKDKIPESVKDKLGIDEEGARGRGPRRRQPTRSPTPPPRRRPERPTSPAPDGADVTSLGRGWCRRRRRAVGLPNARCPASPTAGR